MVGMAGTGIAPLDSSHDDKPKGTRKKGSESMDEFELVLLFRRLTIFFPEPFNPSSGI
jgi:hypothetical protein